MRERIKKENVFLLGYSQGQPQRRYSWERKSWRSYLGTWLKPPGTRDVLGGRFLTQKALLNLGRWALNLGLFWRLFVFFHFYVWALCTLKFQPAKKRKTCTGVCSWSESRVLANTSPVNALQADGADSIEPIIAIWCICKVIPDLGSYKVIHEAIITGQLHKSWTQLERIFCCDLPEEVKNIQYAAYSNGKSCPEPSHFTLDSWHQLCVPAGTFSLGLVASTFNVISGKPLGQQLCPVLLFLKETSVLLSGSTCQNLCDYKQKALQGVVNAS